MFRTAIEWFIRKHWASEYVMVDRVQQLLYEARQHETERCTKIMDENMRHLGEMKDMERKIEVAGLNAHIQHLENMLDDMKDHNKKIEKAEQATKANAKYNFDLSVELKYNVGKLMAVFGETMGRIEAATYKAENHFKKIDRRAG